MNDVIDMEFQDGVNVGGGSGSDEIWLPAVNSDGDLSWSKSSTSTAPATVNIKGPAGEDGADGEDGLGVKSVDINGSNHFIVTYDDDSTHDAGEIPSGGATSEYPNYAKTEMQSVLATIKGYISTLDNPIIIGFDTDQHIDADSDSSSKVETRDEVTYGLKTLRDLTKALPFNFVVLGGDTHGSSAGTIASMQSATLYIIDQMYGTNAPLVALVGNHEGGQDNQNITRGQVYKSHMTKTLADKVVTSVDYTSGYYDDPVSKVRFIFLDSFVRVDIYSTSDVNTVLAAMLSGIPTGYKAIIFSHHPLDENLPQVADRKGWNNPVACHDTLQLYKDKIIACFCGHVHNNLSVDQNGITFVSTTCAGKYELNDGSTRTAGTAAFTAYDVFVIDQTGKKIYAVRYGNGQDREISFAHETPVVPRGNILANVTWEDGKRINSSGSIVDAEGYSTTGIIDDINPGDILYFADGTLPMFEIQWTEYADDGTTVGTHAGITSSEYGATYAGSKLYVQFLSSADENVKSYYWEGINSAKSGDSSNKYMYGELTLWNSGYVKSVKLAYNSSYYQTLNKIRFTFPTDKKASLDIRVNEPFAES